MRSTHILDEGSDASSTSRPTSLSAIRSARPPARPHTLVSSPARVSAHPLDRCGPSCPPQQQDTVRTMSVCAPSNCNSSTATAAAETVAATPRPWLSIIVCIGSTSLRTTLRLDSQVHLLLRCILKHRNDLQKVRMLLRK